MVWFIIDYFTHNLDLFSQARKNFRPQNPNDDTAITEQSDYVWDPEWSHPTFINIPQSISSQAISTISYHRDYVKVVPLTIDATPLNSNTFLPDTRNDSLNSTVIHNENLNGTRNLTQQDIQTPSHFINEEIVQTTTSISPIHPSLTTPRNTNTSLAQVTLQSIVKPLVAPKCSHMDYQTYRPMTVPSKPRKTFTRNTFAEHNYIYAHSSKTNYKVFHQYIQQSISPIHPNLTTPRNTNTSLAQVTLQLTVKPLVAPKRSLMDYQTYRPMTVPSKPRKTFTRNTFAEHNYIYAHSSKTNYPLRKNNNHVCSHYWDNPMTTTNSVNFQTDSHPPQDHRENYPFFQQNKNKKQAPHHTDYLSSDDDYLQPEIFAPYTQEYRTQRS